MASLSDVKAGMQPPIAFMKYSGSNTANAAGAWFTTWLQAQGVASSGLFGAGAYNATLNGVVLTVPTTGSLPWIDANVGSAYLARFSGSFPNPTGNPMGGMLMLCDRLWHNGGIDVTITTAQAIVSPAWPARDENAATAGAGVFLALELQLAGSLTTPTVTVSYTNSAGVAGRTATNINAVSLSATAGRTFPMSLQAGDLGVQSVQSITLSAAGTTALINLVAYRPLAFIPVCGPISVIDAVSACLPKMPIGPVLYFMAVNMVPGAGSFNQFGGTITPTFG